MKIRVRETGEVIGEVITNHSMTIWEACDLAGIDTSTDDDGNYNEYDPEADLEMDYES